MRRSQHHEVAATNRFCSVLTMGVILAVSSGCGRTPIQVPCASNRLSTFEGGQTGLTITGLGTGVVDGETAQFPFTFDAASACVDDATFRTWNLDSDPRNADVRLRVFELMADANHELCLQAADAEEQRQRDLGIDVTFDTTNCDRLLEDPLSFVIESNGQCVGDVDNSVAHNRACAPFGVLEPDGSYGAGGLRMDPMVVQCGCAIQSVTANDGSFPTGPLQLGTFTEQYCLPPGGGFPGDYCRETLAPYLQSTIRMANAYAGLGSGCGIFGPEEGVVDVEVECFPVSFDGREPQFDAALGIHPPQ